MKVSESWLREWVNPSLTGQQLADQLTLAGLEVDGLHSVAGEFNHVVVALVLETTPHPQANKLTLCEIDAGLEQPLKVVCGAANVRAGLRVALALPGAHLPGDIKIQESMLRGHLSQGMLCSCTELGLDERSEGILELPDDAPIGTDLREYLALNDQVLDIDLTPNRADCFSVLGIARDVAALTNTPLSTIDVPAVVPAHDASMAINITTPVACPQYVGRFICGIDVNAKTPLWMKERLRRAGVKTIHPVVDITNYVMFELGQPMHAFDQKTIAGSMQVRLSNAGEALELLDGQNVTFNEPVLLIADSEKPLAIAGVMGGALSAVHAETTDIFLESAFFNPLIIAGVARRYGLCTDSSQRFERGVDPSLQVRALERATNLLIEIVGGNAGPITSTIFTEHLPQNKPILFKTERVKRLTGLELSDDEIYAILKRLEMTIERHDASTWHVTAPSHRFDIAHDVDLVEEVVRLYGYNHIDAKPLVSVMRAGAINHYQQLLLRSAAFLCSRNYHETISYSFVDPCLQEILYPHSTTMQLKNPISSELSQMRVGMWSGLLASMVYNVHRQQTAFKLFEAGVVFDLNTGVLEERQVLAGLIYGAYGDLNWSEHKGHFDFFDMKGDLQALLHILHCTNATFIAKTHPALHPGQSAQIQINGQHAGWLGVLHPRLLDELGLTGEVLLFELSLTSLLNETPIIYQQISKYPQTRRDLSLLVNNDVNALQIEQAIRDVVPNDCLKAFDVFDVYKGESIPAGKKSLALSLTFQNNQRTLIDTEINAIIDAILIKLADDFGIGLRADPA